MLCLLPSSGCSDRYVILDTPPFLSVRVPYQSTREHAVINTVGRFAVEHRLRFGVGGQTPSGGFLATANRYDLNLVASHTSLEGSFISVVAIARGGRPNPEQRATAQDFLQRVRANARGSTAAFP